MKILMFIDRVYSKILVFFSVMSIIALFVSVYLYPRLPNTVPIHFDISNNADNWGNKINVFILGALPLVFCIIFSKKVALSKPMTFYQRIVIEVIGILSLLLLLAVELGVLNVYIKMI